MLEIDYIYHIILCGVVVGSVVNRRRVIYPLSVGFGIGVPMEGLALLPFAHSQLFLRLPKVAAIPSPHNSNTNHNNTNGSLLPSILSFLYSTPLLVTEFIIVIVIATVLRICVSQTAPSTPVSFSRFIVFQGTGRSSSPTPTTAATSHSESQLREWGFHTSEISSVLCFPRSQASSQRFSRPR